MDRQSPKEKTPPSSHSKEPANWSKAFLFGLKALLPIAVLTGAVMGYGLLKASKPSLKKPKVVEKVWAVDVIDAVAKNITPTLHLYGKTVAGRQVELRALVAGKIIEVGPSLKEGALVKKGQMLVRIDDFDYQGAVREAKATLDEGLARQAELKASVQLEQENLKYAQAQLKLAQTDYERASNLAKRGTVSKKLADDRKVIVSQRAQSVSGHKVNLDLQQARLKGQEAVVERLKWKVDQADRRLEETELIAPFDAYVNEVSSEIGRLVSVNDKIANLIDNNQIDVRFTLTDAQYGRILAHETSLIGRKVKAVWKVGDKPIEYTATIKRIGAEIASQSGGVEIYAAIDTPMKPIPVRTGAFVEVKMQDRRYDNVYRVPQTALYNSNTIYLIIDGRLQPQQVKIVGADASDSLISAPLPKGVKILKSRLSLAGPGVKVKPRTSLQIPTSKKPEQTAKTTKGL